MFLCRGARSVVTSSLSYYYNFAGSVQVTTNIPPEAIWALHNASIISCSQVRDSGANSVHVLCLLDGMLQDESVESCVSNAWTACKSASRFGFIWPFSWRSKDRIMNDRLNSPKSFFCLGTDTCTIGSSTNKLLSSALSTASTRKQSNWTKREPATDVQKVNWLSPNENYELVTCQVTQVAAVDFFVGIISMVLVVWQTF